ncbi:thioredoxin family protein [Kytococcus sedentarius]|uniref:thioredoxin family protein n=1 Tax=Kytococcus sedentarius TaxID=1276 RepID=UPI0035BBFED0
MSPGSATPGAVERVRRVEELSELMGESGRAVVVCFTGSWCGSCSLFEPVFEAVADELAGAQRVFAVVDTQEVPALATAYSIRTVPTVAVLRDGVVVDRIDGPVSARVLRERVRRA